MTRLKKIAIRGFRSLKEISWEPANLNVIIGENGSGKSNVLSGLNFLREASRGALRRTILTEGGLQQILWNNVADEIAWSETAEVDEHLTRYDLVISPSPWGGAYVVKDEKLIVDQVDQHQEFSSNGSGSMLLDRNGNRLILNGEESVFSGLKLPAIGQAGPQIAPPERGSISPEETALSTIGGIGGLFLYYGDMFDFALYRDLHANNGTTVRAAVVTRLEQRLDPDGQNLTPFLHTLCANSREFKAALDSAMVAAFGAEFEDVLFPPAADQKVQLRIRWRSLKNATPAASLSDGTLRFLMLVAALANPNPPALIAIDEPETGLHPRMFPIIAELAAAASEKSTVIFTTHSPEFLNAFPHDCIPATTVAELREGATHLTRLDGDDLKRWIKDFSLGQMFVQGDLEALA